MTMTRRKNPKLDERVDTSKDVIDETDYKNLLLTILNQAIDDYVKLQHPATRTKKYLQEFYLTSINLLFDNSYRMHNLKNGYNQDMSTADLVSEILDTDRPDLVRLRAHAVKEAYDYWENKDMAVVDHIPDTVTISGHTFMVQHASIKSFAIDLEQKTIALDKESTQANQINFVKALINVICMLHDITKVTGPSSGTLAKEIFWALKANNCFSYVGVPDAASLFVEQEVREA